MGLLYFFDTTIKFTADGSHDRAQEYVNSCSCIYNAFINSDLGGKGGIKQIWKIPGEPRLIGVLCVDSPGELDAWFKSSLKNLVNNEISSVFTPLRPYEDFAANVGDRLQQETNISPVECVHRNGLHYFLTFTVEYEGAMNQVELFKIWSEEAKAALSAKKSGTVLDLWKVVAQRKVFVIICVDDPGELDQLSFDLPIMKKMGHKVQVTCKSVRDAAEWITELKRESQEAAGYRRSHKEN